MSFNLPPPDEGGQGITTPPGPAQQSLPAGWIQSIGSNGQLYYHNPQTGQAQYAPPHTSYPPPPFPTHPIDSKHGAAADAPDAIPTGATSHHIARASHAAALSCAYDSDTSASPSRDPQYGASGDTPHGAVQWTGQHGTGVPCSSHCLRNEQHNPTPRHIIFDGRSGANADLFVAAPPGSPPPAAQGKALAPLPLLNSFIITNYL
jgi:hypothetical protein